MFHAAWARLSMRAELRANVLMRSLAAIAWNLVLTLCALSGYNIYCVYYTQYVYVVRHGLRELHARELYLLSK